MADEDGIEDMEPVSSAGSETLDAPDTTTEVVEAAKPEQSSPSEKGEATDALSIVRDVVDKASVKEAPASQADGEETGAKPGVSDPKTDPEDYSDVPFSKHPRFQQVVRERREFKVDAERYRNVQTFLDSSGMSAEEAADGLTIMAQAKVDPAGAWQRIKPWVQKVLIAAGEVLPDELNQRVEAGHLDRDTALQLSRTQAQIHAMETQRSFEQQRAERSRQFEAQQSIQTAASTWEEERKVRDPNFDAKIDLLKREIAWLQREEGRPDTPEGVKDQLDRAYKTVSGRFVAPTPVPVPRPTIKPVPSGQQSAAARPAPRDTLDIVRQHVESARAAR